MKENYTPGDTPKLAPSPTTSADMYDLSSDNCRWRDGWPGLRNIYATVPPLAEHLRTRHQLHSIHLPIAAKEGVAKIALQSLTPNEL